MPVEENVEKSTGSEGDKRRNVNITELLKRGYAIDWNYKVRVNRTSMVKKKKEENTCIFKPTTDWSVDSIYIWLCLTLDDI